MRKSGRICFYNMGKKESYAEMLRSPLWQKKRLEIMQRDDFTCQHCGCKERELQVHHRVYHKGAKPWEYEDNELITLCDRCHEAETDAKATHYETFKEICDLARKIGLSEQFIRETLQQISQMLDAIYLHELYKINDRFAYKNLLGTYNNNDALLLFKGGLSLSEDDLAFLEIYWPELIDIYEKFMTGSKVGQ